VTSIVVKVDKGSALRGISISTVSFVTVKGIWAVTYFWLITLLEPSKLGIVTLGLSFYGVVSLFKDFDFTLAVISKDRLTPQFLHQEPFDTGIEPK